MRNPALLMASFLVFLLTSSCQTKETPAGLKRSRLLPQLEQSSQGIILYQKTFTDLHAQEREAEVLQFQKEEMGVDSLQQQLSIDLSYLFDIYYEDASIADWIDIQQQADTLIASVKEGAEKRSKLHLQKVLKNEDGQIVYAYSQYLTSNWLYELDIRIEAHFDSLGNYQSHQLLLRNEVPLLNQSIDSRIKGTASYQE